MNSTAAAIVAPPASVRKPRRLRYKTAQPRNGRGRNQPVSFVPAAQPRITPNAVTASQRLPRPHPLLRGRPPR